MDATVFAAAVAAIRGFFSSTLFKAILTTLVGVLGMYVYYAYTVFLTWEEEMARKRVTRRQKESPSNKKPPGVSPWEVNREMILEAAEMHLDNFSPNELLDNLCEADGPAEDINETHKERSSRTSSFAARAPPSKRVSEQATEIKARISGSLSKERAEYLDMDHVYISYGQFLWALTFIGPFSMFLWMSGIAKLMLRKFLYKHGMIQKIPFDPAEIVATLLLEGTIGIQYYSASKDKKIAGFYYANFPIISGDGSCKIFDLFAVEIDLEKKTMVSAKLDDRVLTASEAFTLCFFNTIAMNHVKMHAMANWGVNMEEEQWEHDYFVARSSLVTVIYNYFGYRVFGKFFEGWSNLGLLQSNFSAAWVKCVNVGIETGIWSHPQIRDLTPHSTFLNFLIKARVIFMAEFDKHKSCFPGIHGEAFFVGTIMHSLDHTVMDINVKDPLWLDIDHPEFGLMAQIGQVVKVGFVKDVPFLYFHKRFKGSGHPFYDSVYEKCAKINEFLASNMDTCIIK